MSADPGEDVRSEVTILYPWQDEESGIVDDEVQVARTLFVRPANELIPRLGLPGACAETQQGNDLTCGAHEVTQLRARHELMTEVVAVVVEALSRLHAMLATLFAAVVRSNLRSLLEQSGEGA